MSGDESAIEVKWQRVTLGSDSPVEIFVPGPHAYNVQQNIQAGFHDESTVIRVQVADSLTDYHKKRDVIKEYREFLMQQLEQLGI